MNITKPDWFGFRSNGEIPEITESLAGCFALSGNDFNVVRRKSGWMGFKSSANLCIGDMVVGMMAYGGDSQRGSVTINITGKGCEWVADWGQAQDSVMSLPGYEVRRLDIALDTFKREVTHTKVVQAYRSGLFNLIGAGRPPSMTKIEPEDYYEGATAYVGSRENAKFLRAYEKGYQMVKSFPRHLNIQAINGIPIADMYRLELELKAKQGPLPLDLIDKRDQYFAGAYPYLQTVLDVKPEVFVQRREKGPQSDLAAMLEHVRFQYGNTLFTALMAHGGDIGAVWEKIVGRKHNETLLAAGVLLVEHE